MSKKIKPDEFYAPGEIVDLGILTANTPDTKRQMLLRHIRQGKVKAKNLGGDKKPRYVILGKDLIAYHKAQIKAGEYIKK